CAQGRAALATHLERCIANWKSIVRRAELRINQAPLEEIGERAWRKWGGAARCPSCSQNAHDETVLVRCAQLRAALATPFKRGMKNRKALAWANGTSREIDCEAIGG